MNGFRTVGTFRWMPDDGLRWHGPVTEYDDAVEAFAKSLTPSGWGYNMDARGQPLGFEFEEWRFEQRHKRRP